MQQRILKVKENIALTDSVYKMILEGDTSAIKHAGEFVNLEIPSLFLRRPISVCDYKVVGEGTEIMAKTKAGDELDVLLGLGNGYDISLCEKSALLLGGGVGVPPMYNLCKKLIAAGKKVSVVLGFNTASEIFYEDEFKALGADVRVTTVDGSYGIKGFVTDAISDIDYDHNHMCEKKTHRQYFRPL